MRIIFGDVTCRCLSAIWVLANAGGQGEGERGGKQQQHFIYLFLTTEKLHKIPIALLWNQLSAKQTAQTVFYVRQRREITLETVGDV